MLCGEEAPEPDLSGHDASAVIQCILQLWHMGSDMNVIHSPERCFKMRMGLVLRSLARISFVFLGVAMMGGCQVKRASSVGLSEWERVKRVTVHNSPRRSRYPSIARAGDGALLVLFMRQTAEQEAAGQGDLVLARSTDEGQSWSDAEIVYTGREGEPRAVGSMTILNSGRIIAPFA